MSKFAILASVALALSTPALAADIDGDEWRIVSQTDEGRVLAIASGTDKSNGAFFTCAGNALKVAVGVVPGDMKEMVSTPTSRKRSHSVRSSINGGEAINSDWTYLPSTKVAIGKDVVIAKKFYNAAVKGEPITWKMPFKDEVAISFPEMNDTFKAFANDCPVTNPDNAS